MSKITVVCKVCKIDKPQEEYYFHSANRLRNDCKACVGKRHKEQKFNLDHKSYLELLTEQEGRCGICAIHVDDYSTRYKNLHVDHCHTTGKIRGLLCHRCNTGLGLFKDSTYNLQSAIDYLRE